MALGDSIIAGLMYIKVNTLLLIGFAALGRQDGIKDFYEYRVSMY